VFGAEPLNARKKYGSLNKQAQASQDSRLQKLVLACEDVDAAARKIIIDAGFGTRI
jgi:hypothetical protein